jgi:hypothetical protein
LGQGTIELEPNNEILKPNLLPLEKWVNGSIESESDVDYFKFTTPQQYRDIIKVEVKNKSTTLKPYLALWAANKNMLWESSEWAQLVTAGRNLKHSFSTEPNSDFYISIGGFGTQGVYEAKITPLKAYDSYEPNEDILHAKPISLGTTIEANIMDGSDSDFYIFNTPSTSSLIIIAVENQSASLKPYLAVYNANKVLLWESSTWEPWVTSGQNLKHSFPVDPNTGYYAVVRGLRTSGNYRLNVREANEDILQTVK